MDSSKVKCFDGKGDVKVFLTRVKLIAAIKEYGGEKKAQFLASTLLPPALDVYMRLSEEDQKDFTKVEEALLKEFQKGQLNREEAIHVLSDRKQQQEESPQTFAYKIVELVKLAYPAFGDPERLTIAKDYYMRGVHPAMQVALKSWSEFETSDVHKLAVETVRLELAGIKSFSLTTEVSASSVNVVKDTPPEESNIINAVAEKVMEKLQLGACSDNPDNTVQFNASYSPTQFSGGANNFSRGQPYRGRGNNRRNRGQNRGDGRQQKKCRACKAFGHVVKECPQRFCQSCGNRGHDQWSKQ